jgi:hypothetical protein
MNTTTRTQDATVQGSRRFTRRGLRAVCGAMAAAALAAIVAAPAQAEYANLTAQAVRAHADWLAWAPAPAGGPVAVCLVDTGVDPNPDTSSTVIAAQPLDANSAPGDGGTTKHGTLMAQIMAAPLNGYGMVGVWPQLKIVDVRAVTPGANTFTYSNYQRAVQRCALVDTGGVPVKVVNLSLGGDPSLVTQEERDELANAVTARQAAGVNIVAAAGNAGGGVLTPGDLPSIFTVAAGDNGALCGFASRGPEVDIAAPGCGLDQAFADGFPAVNGWGSSQASAFTSAVIAALRAYKPSLTVAQAEAALTSTATPIAGGYSQLDVESAFESVGLSQLVADAKAAETAGLATAPTGGSTGGGGAPSAGGGGGGGGGGGAGSAKPTDACRDTASTATCNPDPAPTPAPQPAAATPAPTTNGAVVPDAVDDPIVTPKVRPLVVTSKGTRLTLANRPKDAMAIVRVYAKTHSRERVVKTIRANSSTVTIKVRSWAYLTVQYRDGLSPDSAPVKLRAPRKTTARGGAR